MLYSNTPAIVYRFEEPIQKNYENLKEEYFHLKKSVETLINSNLENELYKDKLNFIDMRIINNNDKQFTEYEVGIMKRVENKLLKKYILDEEQLNNLLELRKELLDLNKEFVTMDTIGTVLNYLREFYKDLELDIEQSKKIDIPFTLNNFDVEKNKRYFYLNEELTLIQRYKVLNSINIKNKNESEWDIEYATSFGYK